MPSARLSVDERLIRPDDAQLAPGARKGRHPAASQRAGCGSPETQPVTSRRTSDARTGSSTARAARPGLPAACQGARCSSRGERGCTHATPRASHRTPPPTLRYTGRGRRGCRRPRARRRRGSSQQMRRHTVTSIIGDLAARPHETNLCTPRTPCRRGGRAYAWWSPSAPAGNRNAANSRANVTAC